MPIGVRDVAKPVFVKECFMRTAVYLSACALTLAAGAPRPKWRPPPLQESRSSRQPVPTTWLDETFRPKFIYYAVGHSRKGSEAVLDVAGIDRIQPQLEEYCKVNPDEVGLRARHEDQHRVGENEPIAQKKAMKGKP